MTPGSVTEIKDVSDKVVVEVFLQIQNTAIKKDKLHYSEEFNRDKQTKQLNFTIYDVINHYHVYCKLCSQHFYAQSVVTDINSYFQKHINTNLHKSCKIVNPCPGNMPIFTWETFLEIGRCNVCDMSGIYAYIIDSVLTPEKLLGLHKCKWEKCLRENNGKTIWKIELIKQFCSINLFGDLFLLQKGNDVICRLCNIKLTGTKVKTCYHLLLDNHNNKLWDFIWKVFNMNPSDLLNGFNLERVIRCVLVNDMKPYEVDRGVIENCDEYKKCLEESNDGSHVYQDIEHNSGFTPKIIKEIIKVHHSDFVYNGWCLLCEQDKLNPDHMNSKTHLEKFENLSQFEIAQYSNNEIYLSNREIRLRPYQIQIKMYNQLYYKLRRLKEILEEPSVEEIGKIFVKAVRDQNMSVKKSSNNSKDSLDQSNLIEALSNLNKTVRQSYVEHLIEKKLNKAKKIFTVVQGGYVNCEICDQRLPVHCQDEHLSGKGHKTNFQAWEALKFNVRILKFVEPIISHKENLLCLICGVSFSSADLFSHFKSNTHNDNFNWYAKSNYVSPISSSFLYKVNNACICKTCNSQINKSDLSLRGTLSSIKNHWPCTGSKTIAQETLKVKKLEKSQNLGEVLNKLENSKGNGLTENENTFLHVNCEKTLNESEVKPQMVNCTSVNSVNFNSLQEIFQSFMNVFEDKIVQSIAQNLCTKVNEKLIVQQCLVNNDSRNNSVEKNGISGKNDAKKLNISKEVLFANSKTEGSEAVVKKSKIKIRNTIDTDEDAKKNENEEKEALIVPGLPEHIKDKYKLLYFMFKFFGKIDFVKVKGDVGIVVFKNPGVAKKVRDKGIFLNNKSLKLRVSYVKTSKYDLQKIVQLNKDVEFKLKPQRLLSFCQELIAQSVAIQESSVERAREQSLCKTITMAVSECFPSAECYGFGSRISGLATENSDFDVFLNCGGMYEGLNKTGHSSKTIVNKIAYALKKCRECRDIKTVTTARVPIVSFLHVPSNLRCDISFRYGLGVQNTNLLRFLLSLDSRVKPLILFLKYWAKAHKLHGRHYFSSYALAMLVIFYLQQLPKPILPSVETLQKNYVGRRLTIEGWDCNFSTDVSLLPKTANTDLLLKIFLDLFDFYATFEYSQYVISPLTGTPLPRDSFLISGSKTLPLSYARHIVNKPVENNDNYSIVVIDPFDLSHILTKNFSKYNLSLFTDLCKLTANQLKNTVF